MSVLPTNERWVEHQNKQNPKYPPLGPEQKNMLNRAAWFYAEPSRAEKHVQEDKRNMRQTELDGGI